mgnify:CR=1 FL=1
MSVPKKKKSHSSKPKADKAIKAEYMRPASAALREFGIRYALAFLALDATWRQ